MNLKEYRQLKGMTQNELAKELSGIVAGIDGPLVSKMEKGICEPPAAIKAYLSAQEGNLEDKQMNLTADQGSIFLRLMTASRENPVGRPELCLLTGMSDRMMRKAIEDMRKQGIRVCADSGKYGYWLAQSEEDYKAFRGELLSRAYSQLKTVSAMDKFVEGQITINGNKSQ